MQHYFLHRTALLLALLLCVGAVWGCGQSAKDAGQSAAGGSSAVLKESAGDDSAAENTAASVEEGVTQYSAASTQSEDFSVVTTIPAEDMPNDVSLTPPHSEAELTSSEDFNEVFLQNPIDKDYNRQSKTAETTQQMVELAEKYITIWDAEIDSAYTRLYNHLDADGRQALKNEQDHWRVGLEKAIQKIYDDAAADSDGTIAQVAASSGVMEYYKNRAIELYERLFTYEPELTYVYQSGEN